MIGGVSPAFFGMNQEAQYDSWITLGMDDGSDPDALGQSPDLNLNTWIDRDTGGFYEDNGAIFWMNPNRGPSGNDIVLGQFTIQDGRTNRTFSGLLQGQSTEGMEDWQAPFTIEITGGSSGGNTVNAGNVSAANVVVDCVGNWGVFEDCTADCGGGTQTRTYTVSVPASNGGTACIYADGDPETQPCNTQACPVDETQTPPATGPNVVNAGNVSAQECLMICNNQCQYVPYICLLYTSPSPRD